MRIRHLKQLRIFFALVFFLPALFLFLDFRDSGFRAIAGEVLFLQFVPSLLQFMDSAAIGAAGFILVLILTLVFGRVYCSFVCPLGIYQDLISRLARKRISWPGKKRKRYRSSYSRPHYFLWYAVLILTVLFFGGQRACAQLAGSLQQFRPDRVSAVPSPGVGGKQPGGLGAGAAGKPFPLPGSVAGIRPGFHGDCPGNADGGGMVECPPRSSLLQHPVSGRGTAGAVFKSFDVSDPHFTG